MSLELRNSVESVALLEIILWCSCLCRWQC